jgi:hypothetical protein
VQLEFESPVSAAAASRKAVDIAPDVLLSLFCMSCADPGIPHTYVRPQTQKVLVLLLRWPFFPYLGH